MTTRTATPRRGGAARGPAADGGRGRGSPWRPPRCSRSAPARRATTRPAVASGGGGAPLSCPVPVGPMALAVSGRANSPEPGLPSSVQQAAISVVAGAADQKVQPKFTVVDVDGRPTVAGSDTYRTDAGNAIAAQDDQNAFLSGLGKAVGRVSAPSPPRWTCSAPWASPGARYRAAVPGTVVLVDSGLSTVAPLDFRQQGLLDAPVAGHRRVPARPPGAART